MSVQIVLIYLQIIKSTNQKIMNSKPSSNISSHNNKDDHSGRPLAFEPVSKDKLIDQEESQILERLMTLEGECKIQSYQFVKFNLIKTVLLLIPIIMSVVCLFFLKYSMSFRVCVCYDKAKIWDATHLYIKGNYKASQIVTIESKNPIKFHYKKLSYVIEANKAIPIGYKYQKYFRNIFSDKHMRNGLDEKQVEAHSEIFGKNQHKIQIPTYPQYMLDILTTPFFLLQYVFCFIFILEGYTPFAIALLFFSFVAATINYILLYISYDKIKEMAERKIIVSVLRNGQLVNIDSTQLVPGDVFQPKQQLLCDALVLRGDVYVNEANLTGQSYPIGKFPVTDLKSIKMNNRWLFEGSKVLEYRPQSLAIVINIGFQTFRGRIIRRILTRQVKQPDILRSALVFLGEVFIITIISFFGCLPLILNRDIESLFILFQFFNFLAAAVPPPLPIFFNIAYSFALSRLKLKDISGTEPQKIVDGAYLKTMCFDKTGTLTQVDVEIKKILKIGQNGRLQDIKERIMNRDNSLITKLFSCCHTVKEIKGEILGDEIDKEMYLSSEFKMQVVKNPHIKFITEGKNDEIIEVLRINQFQSKFQSMSVLVRDVIANTFYVFAKGAPQKMKKNSINPLYRYDEAIQQLCLTGYRTISFGYKIIEKQNIQQILYASRQVYQQNLTLLGVIGFENKLKGDARKTIKKLYEANIKSKMITGDNIFIAVQTSTRAGIVKRNTPIILLEGEKQLPQRLQEKNRKFIGTVLTRTKERSMSKRIQLTENDTYLTQTLPIAIDNAFLTLSPPPVLTDQIALYARIPPENKALIVSKYKQKIKKNIEENQTRFQKFLKKDKLKIGMCGDGANDLLALKQADLSLGIQQSDASYGSSFTIKKLLDVDEIIRQSKCTQANVIQLFQYYGATSLFGLFASVIMINDVTYFSNETLMFFSFTTTLIFPALFSFSRPATKPTKYTPQANFMCLHNHLIYWGNVFIPLLGVIAGYFYFYNTDEFQFNPRPVASVQDQFYSKNHTATLIFLMVLIPFNLNALFIYSSSPWKQKFYGNIPFAILITVNVSVAILFFFITRLISNAFTIVPISQQNAAIVLGILSISIVVGLVYNLAVRACKLDHKVIE